MPTLYLSAPTRLLEPNTHRRAFETILHNRIGPDYAIYSSIRAQFYPGCRAVVFDRDNCRRAEGVIAQITPKLSQRIQRYDLRIPDLHEVAYIAPPKVNRCGVLLVP
jgi:hypothetical protein